MGEHAGAREIAHDHECLGNAHAGASQIYWDNEKQLIRNQQVTRSSRVAGSKNTLGKTQNRDSETGAIRLGVTRGSQYERRCVTRQSSLKARLIHAPDREILITTGPVLGAGGSWFESSRPDQNPLPGFHRGSAAPWVTRARRLPFPAESLAWRESARLALARVSRWHAGVLSATALVELRRAEENCPNVSRGIDGSASVTRQSSSIATVIRRTRADDT